MPIISTPKIAPKGPVAGLTPEKEVIRTEVKYRRLPLGEDGKLLPAGPRLKSPAQLVIVKYPKSGATLSLCDVPKILIGDSEKGTSDFNPRNVVDLIDLTVSGQFKETTKYGFLPQTIFDIVDELKHANNMNLYWKIKNEMEAERDLTKAEELYKHLLDLINKMPFPIFALDTITSLINLSNDAALHEYRKEFPKAAPKESIKRVDEYGGVSHIRRKFSEIKSFIETNAAPFIQYHGHVAPRKRIMKKEDSDIGGVDIALEGIMAVSFTAFANAVCTFYREEKKGNPALSGCFLDFTKKDETDMGSRPRHLSNQVIKIAELLTHEEVLKSTRPVTHWNQVYPEIDFS